MSREDPQMKLRLPEGLRDRIKAFADANRRSMNAEIIERLEQSISADEKLYGAPPEIIRQQTEDLLVLARKLTEELQNATLALKTKSD